MNYKNKVNRFKNLSHHKMKKRAFYNFQEILKIMDSQKANIFKNLL